MRLLILDQNYPHLGNLMGDVFVHVRAKEYLKHHEVRVFSYFQQPSAIEYEGIHLERFDNIDSLAEAVKAYNADKILIHFYQPWMLEKIIKQVSAPVIIWVHLFEAIGWYRRLFNFKWYSPVLINYILKNTHQQFYFRKLIKYANKTNRFHFVFVSNWIKKAAERDSLSIVKNYDVIPNPIDVNLFQYHQKNPELRKKVLLLRSFDSPKYANDISVDAIVKLSKKEIFSQFSFTIIGKGNLFERTVKPLKDFKNVSITEGAVRQVMIPELHKEFGIFLCPTRQDSHGVSMCEAMASGLVPIASDNSAIPEYVKHNHSGILTTSSQQIADAMEFLFHNPEIFMSLSANASQSIGERCSIKTISDRELNIINTL